MRTRIARTRIAALERPRLERPSALPVLAAALLLALASVLAVSLAAPTDVRAGIPPGPCSILISSESSPVPAETATIIAGEAVQVAGTGFSPNVTLDITVVFNGVPQATFPQATDGSGNFLLTGSLTEEQVGSWTLTAAELNVCSDVVAFEVVLPPPPDDLPDAAMEPIPPAPASGPATAFALLYVVLLVMATGWSVALEVRYRRRTR
jgi:hypothetical protein